MASSEPRKTKLMDSLLRSVTSTVGSQWNDMVVGQVGGRRRGGEAGDGPAPHMHTRTSGYRLGMPPTGVTRMPSLRENKRRGRACWEAPTDG